MQSVTDNLKDVKDRISGAADTAGRAAADVTLVAVSKTFGPARIEPAIAAGHRVFGENRVQEAAEKWPGLRQSAPDIVLHLIGPLQTNKVKQAVDLFDVIQTLDRPKLARFLANEMDRAGKQVPCFIQVNTGEEPQKAGLPPRDVDAFVTECRDVMGLPIAGLMCIPPFDQEPAPHFALLGKLAERNGLDGLSMGMSGDFETAVMLGATHVRVGSAIFGARDKA